MPARVLLLLVVCSLVAQLATASHYYYGSGSGTCSPSSTYCGGAGSNGGYACWCDEGCFTYRDCCFNVRPMCFVPVVTTVSPSLVNTDGSTTITITGNKFNNVQPANQLKGLQGSVQLRTNPSSTGPNCAIVSNGWTNGQIRCTVPAGSGTSYRIFVQTRFENQNDQSSVTDSSITVSYRAPEITAITPNTNVLSGGGTTLTIDGRYFGPSGQSVTVGGASCNFNPGLRSDTQLRCTIPAGQGSTNDVRVSVGGQNSNTLNLAYKAPSITGLSPATASTAGTSTLTLTGTSFGSSGATVAVGTSNCPVTFQSHTSVRCSLPAGQGTGFQVRLTVSGQQSNAVSFSYSAPSISTISPNNGPTNGGTPIVVSGSSFGTSGSVVIGGTAVSYSGASHNSISLAAPVGNGVNREVQVVVGGQFSNVLSFNYDAPTVTGVTGASSFPTQGSVSITVAGTSFGLSNTVTVGGVNCPVQSRTPHTHIVCTLPPGQGSVDVVVTVSSQSSSPYSINYDIPVVSGVNPTSSDTPGGGIAVVSGSNFGSSGEVLFGTFRCFVTSWSHTSISCSIPAGEGTGLGVKITSGSQQNNPITTTFSYNAPTFSGTSPTSGPTSGGTAVTISGSNFGLAPVVTVGGLACSLVSVAHNQVVCNSPVSANVAGAQAISITAKDHTPLSAGSFTYDRPSVASLSPDHGATDGNYAITISGSSFGSSPGTVSVGGVNCLSYPLWTHSTIRCTVPAGQGSNRDVIVTATGSGLTSLVSASAKFSYDVPVLSSISPSAAVTGVDSGPATKLTLVGSNFGTVNPTVTVGGQACTVTSRSHQEVQCNIPDGVGAGQIVSMTVASLVSNSLTFNYLPPTITSINPSSGSTAGGVPFITLAGSSFGKFTPPEFVSVTVGGNDCPVQSQTHTQVVCTPPAGTGTSNNVKITVGEQSSTSSVFYSYQPPTITALSAPSGTPTAGGVPITLNGTNFGNDIGAASVNIGGQPAVVATAPTHTQLVFTLPAGEGVALDVVVTIASQTSNTFPLSYEPPQITGVSPPTGNTTGGSRIVVTGSNFGLTAATTVGGADCLSPTRTHTQITCDLPAGQGTSQNVVVQVLTRSSNAFAFSYSPPSIDLPLIIPSRSTGGGSIMTVNGWNFGTSGTVTLGSLTCAPITNGWTHSRIQCQLPAGQGINLPVVVSAGDQSSQSTASFSYDPPSINGGGISPLSGSTAGGTPVTITGSNFGIVGTKVFIGNWQCPISSQTHTQIVCTLTEGYGTSLDVTVTLPNQPNATQASAFSYEAPVIQSISPSNGGTAGGYLVTLLGTSFGSPAGTVNVAGSLTCDQGTGTSWSHVRVVCIMPASQGTVTMRVTTAHTAVSGTVNFEYNGPTLQSINPQSAYTGLGNRVITLSGSSFGTTGASVTIGGQPGGSIVQSHNQITCTVPTGEGTSKTVFVTVDGKQSNSLVFNYDPPTITGCRPCNGPTLGNVPIQLTGTSFGTSGTVTIGGRGCSVVPGTHTHNTLNCTLPPGEGVNLAIAMNIGGQSSSSLVSFNYDPPVIDTVSPLTGPTQGQLEITLTGSNFGLGSAFAQIGGVTCPTVVNGFSDGEIKCTLPVGQGTGKEVLVTVGALSSNTKLFSYDPPQVYSVSPNKGPTDGNTLLDIRGINFGTARFATIGGQTCLPSAISGDHTSLFCRSPEGAGANFPVVVVVGTQQSNGSVTFDYNAPALSSLEPNHGPTRGAVTLTLKGSSFGTSPQVSVGSQPCVLLSNSHGEVQCTLPAGMGSVDVQLTTGGQTSGTLPFLYDRPVINSITPATGPTQGGYLLTIEGDNFGTAGTVTINGTTCEISGSAIWRYDRIECLVPSGRGRNKEIVITVGGQVNVQGGAAIFSYDVPTISYIMPTTGPTDGSVPMTVVGTNFGCESGVPSDVFASFGSHTPITPTSCNHTYMVFQTPADVGGPLSTSVSVGAQQSNSLIVFRYQAPTITRVSGCAGDSATAALLCPIGGTTPITIDGTNFGPPTSATVTIGGAPCVGTQTGHTRYVCPLPAGVGFDLPVAVTVGGQVATEDYLSYVHPIILPNTLRLLPSTDTGNIVLPNVDGGQSVSFDGRYLSTVKENMWVSYGPPGQTDQFNCTITTVVTSGNNETVTCTTSSGVGQNLVFRVVIFSASFAPQISADGVDTVTYPGPIITPNTLRSLLGQESNKLQSTNSQGQIVLFRGQNFGTDPSILSVRYGPAVNLTSEPFPENTFPCTQISLPQTNQIQCTTSPGFGDNLVFVVKTLNVLSAPGNDTYDYPKPPSVVSVTGCPGQSGKQTTLCPTEGGTQITLVGTSFSAQDITVKIGARDCLNFVFVDNSKILCTVPPGTGFDQTIVVVVGLLFSQGVQYLSYAPPSITAISHGQGLCQAVVNDNTQVERCPRGGGSLITLTGSNFGPADAIVLVGGVECTNVVHDGTTPNSQLTCSLPPGRDLDRSVFMVQGDGESSTAAGSASLSIKVSYAPCDAGQAPASASSVVCSSCPPGKFTSQEGQPLCLDCQDGAYATGPGATQCVQCPAGSFSSAGAANCTQCTPGRFASFAGQAACVECPAGRYQSNSSADRCAKCVPGRFAAGEGQQSCAPCPTGSYSTEGALACEACPPGTFSDSSLGCVACSPGRYQSSSGSSVCQECPTGTAVASTAQTVCPPCESGQFANDTELTACFKCPAGKYSAKAPGSNQGPSTCVECSPGTFMSVAGQGGCINCVKGSASSATGAIECPSCTAGKIAALDGQQSCTPCPKGSISAANGSAVCTLCEFGRYAPDEGQSVCEFCSSGFFQGARGASECLVCAVDTVSRAAGQADCKFCPTGTFAAVNGSSDCTKCSAGQFKNAGSANATCENCPPGTFGAGQGQGLCQACDVGTFSNVSASTGCTECNPGFFVSNPGATVCTICPSGKFAVSSKSFQCELCPEGKHQPGVGQTGCLDCKVGEAQPLSGQDSCGACVEGTYSPAAGQGVCLVCPAGSFSNTTGSSSCYECPTGYFQSLPSQQQCLECSPGTFNQAVGQAKCSDCAPGTYQPLSGSSFCRVCAGGTASAILRATTCANCSAGTYAPGCTNCTAGDFVCRTCDVGSYQPNPASTGCIQCLPGTFQAQLGQSACQFCPRGFFAPGTGEGQCLSCPPGRANNETGTFVTECTQCQPGFYTAQAGSAECLPCAPGTVSAYNNTIVCDSCPPGQYSPVPGQSVCSFCSAGRFSPSQGASVCSNCTAGTFQNNENQGSCFGCPSGKYSTANSSTWCTPCPLGRYSVKSSQNNVGPTACSLCQNGTYMPQTGQSFCWDAPAGTFTNTSGAVDVLRCQLGEFNPNNGQSRCTKCPVGKFSDKLAFSNPSCLLCPAGFYNDQPGSSRCTECSPGTAQSAEGSSTCSQCPSGQQSSAPGQAFCKGCDPGKFANVSGLSSCYFCPPGWFNPKDKGISCTRCNPGYFSSSGGQTGCVACGFGEYVPYAAASSCVNCPLGSIGFGTGLSQCTNCTAGKFAKLDGGKQLQCELCPRGTYGPTPGLASCLPCQRGFFQSTEGALVCDTCPEGKYSQDEGSVVCLDCPPGKFSNSSLNITSRAACQECAPGYFNQRLGAGICLPCPAGSFASDPQSVTCSLCFPGQHTPNAGMSRCVTCDAGTFAETEGRSECEKCAVGRFQRSANQASCAPCEIGQFANTTGLNECLLCPAGKFINVKSSSFCSSCKAGFFTQAQEQGSCDPCPTGQYAPGDGITRCLLCGNGTFADIEGSKECKRCAMGKYAPDSGTQQCLLCEGGRFSNVLGATTCDACPRNSYQPGEGETQCLPCPAGNFSLDSGKMSCPACAVGRFNNVTGQSVCRDCLPGFVSNSTDPDRRICRACPAGTHQIGSGQTSCTACPLRRASATPGVAECAKCSPGKFMNVGGALTCFRCAPGFYQPNEGALRCLACPIGRYTTSYEARECTPCAPGTFEDRSNSTQCKDCQAGDFSGLSGSIRCDRCIGGRYTNVSGRSECSLCEYGKYVSVNCSDCGGAANSQKCTGATSCLACGAGKFASNLGQTSCTLCEPGSFNNGTGKRFCDLCLPGTVMQDYGATNCSSCEVNTFSGSFGQVFCRKCPAGTHGTPQIGLSKCVDCEAGRATLLEGQAQCADCDRGRFASSTGSKRCSPCTAGTYAAGTGAQTCRPCETGKFGNTTLLTQCFSCPKGTFNALERQEGCQSCAAGSFSNTTQLSECYACEAGTFMSGVAATACDRCPAGSISAQPAAISCALCETGLVAATSGLSVCAECTGGTHAPNLGMLECVDCPPGTSVSGLAAAVCDPCAAGRAHNLTKQTSCPRCKAGYYQSFQRQTSCLPCGLGSFSPSTEQTKCLLCPPTSFANTTAQISCHKCAIGRFQNSTGSSRCFACDLGKSQAQPAQSSCLACDVGKYGDVVEASNCTDCSPGYFGDAPGLVGCFPCGKGQFAEFGKQRKCDICIPGRFGDREAATSCDRCPEGRISKKQGLSQCEVCEVGTFAPTPGRQVCDACPSGRFANMSGASFCYACPPGTHSPQPAQSACSICPPGKFTEISARSQCLDCGRGTFNPNNGSTSCTACPGGYKAGATGSLACEPCPEGYFAAPGSANEQCTRCPLGTVAPEPAAPNCTACDTRSTSDVNRTRCICDEGFYATLGTETFAQCESCPDGADCGDPGTTFLNMGARSGWWRADGSTLTFYRCLREEHCVGGRAGANGAPTCQPHRVNPLCAVCEDNYHTFFGGECVPCPQTGGAVLYIVFVTFIGILIYMFAMWLVVRAGQALLDEETEEARAARFFGDEERPIGLGLGGGGAADPWFGAGGADVGRPKENKTIKMKNFLIQRPADFMFKFKIVVGFAQIVTNLGISLEVPWPTAFKRFISFFSIFNLDVINASSVDCVTEAGFYQRFVFASVAPFVAFAGLAIFYLAVKYIRIMYFPKKDSPGPNDSQRSLNSLNEIGDEHHEKRVLKKRARRNFWKMYIMTLFLLYPLVSSTIFQLFVCKNVEGTRYLLADMRQICGSARWNGYAGWGYLMIILVPIGIPAFFFYMIYRYRRKGRLHEPGVKAELGILYDAYDNQIWWFEMPDMLHKLITTSLLAFLPSDWQLPVGLVVVLGYSILMLLVKPYKRKGDDRLHLLVQAEIWLYIYAGYLFFLEVDSESNYDVVLSVVMISMTIGLCLYFVSQFLWVIKKRFLAWKAEKYGPQGKPGIPDTFQSMELARTVRHNPKKERKTNDDVDDDVALRNVHLAENPLAGAQAEKDMEMAATPSGAALMNNPLFGLDVPDDTGDVSYLKTPSQAGQAKRNSFLALPDFETGGDDEDGMTLSLNPLLQMDGSGAAGAQAEDSDVNPMLGSTGKSASGFLQDA